MILVGSRALKQRYPDQRNWIDTDYIGTYSEVTNFINQLEKRGWGIETVYTIKEAKYMVVKLKDGGAIYEFEIAWDGSSAEEILNLPGAALDGVATPNLLFFLKSSHKYLKNSPHFLKTMRDYNFLKEQGCFIPHEWRAALNRRVKETYNYAHPKLNTSKDEFFKKEDKFYVYDHDSIHLAVKHLEKPAYEYFKGANEEVYCDRNKWEQQTDDIKQLAVLEESYVLALERSQIPYYFTPDPEKSFLKALEKVCTSITSGWFREYAYNNYDKVVARYAIDGKTWYVTAFHQAYDARIVKHLAEPGTKEALTQVILDKIKPEEETV